MEYKRYTRGIKWTAPREQGGKPTAHEIRIQITDPHEQEIIGAKTLTKFLASGGDPEGDPAGATPHAAVDRP